MDMPKQPDGPVIEDGKTYSEIAHLAEDAVPFVAIASALRSAGLEGAAAELFTETALALAKRPPAVEGELESLRSLLANLTHVAKVLGKKRTLALVKAMNERDEDLELVAAAAYRWAISRETRGSATDGGAHPPPSSSRPRASAQTPDIPLVTGRMVLEGGRRGVQVRWL